MKPNHQFSFVSRIFDKQSVFNPAIFTVVVLLSSLFCLPLHATAKKPDYRVQLFFGLSKPNGGGVSLKEWRQFESQQITLFFKGFNVIDSVGYYQGEAERSKVVTIFTYHIDLQDTHTKATALSQIYVDQFNQDSVMMVTSELQSWQFIKSQPEK